MQADDFKTSQTIAGRAHGERIAFIQAGWHKDILNPAREAFLSRMLATGMPSGQIDCFDVPGAFEIPLLARRLANGGRHAAIVGAAFVVNGGIYRHDFVAQAVVDGLMRVQLEADIPVFSLVLTPHHFHEHAEHQAFFARHFIDKGTEVANACIGMLAALEALPEPMHPFNAGEAADTMQTHVDLASQTYCDERDVPGMPARALSITA